jgi:hypothetical protein
MRFPNASTPLPTTIPLPRSRPHSRRKHNPSTRTLRHSITPTTLLHPPHRHGTHTARTSMISPSSSSVPKHPYPTTLPLLRQAAYARERLGEEHERAESERDGRILDETWGVTASGRAYGRGGEYRSCGLRHERAVRPRITLLTL